MIVRIFRIGNFHDTGKPRPAMRITCDEQFALLRRRARTAAINRLKYRDWQKFLTGLIHPPNLPYIFSPPRTASPVEDRVL